MKRAAASAWLSAFFFTLGWLGTPLHLALEDHAWHPDADHGDHPHDPDRGSDHASHPAADHEVTAIAKAFRLVLAPVDLALHHVLATPPVARTWSPGVEADAHSPPDADPTPPRSPRAPPV